MVRIIRRKRVGTIGAALMEDERTGEIVVCMPPESISASGALALGDVLTTWAADRLSLGASLPHLAAEDGHV